MRFLSSLFTLLLAVALTACGGGGGSPGSNPNTPTLFTTAPATLTLPIGALRSYSVRGGVPPYAIQNSDARVVAGFVNGEVLTLNSSSQGQATVTILDNKGAALSITVTVGRDLKLSLDNVQSFVGDTVNVTISGGTPPYRTSTVDLGVKAVVNGDQLIMTLGVVGDVDVAVLDANDQSAKVKVTVINGTPQIRISPNAVTVSESDTRPLTFTVFGAGSGPIIVNSSDPTLLKASVSGSTVTVVTGTNEDRCVDADKQVTFSVVDSRGAVATAVVTIANSSGGCSDLTAPTGDFVVQAGATRSVVLGGDASGGYQPSSDNELVATATFSGGVLTIKGIAWVCPTPAPAATASSTAEPTCATSAPASRTANITVTDIAHPKRFVTLKVTVLTPA